MINTVKLIFVLLIGITTIGVPVWVAVWEAKKQSIDSHTQYALSLATEAMRLTEATNDEIATAIASLKAHVKHDPCADDAIILMRKLTFRTRYLQGLGYAREERLLCSSYGRHDEVFELGKVEHENKSGIKIRTDVKLPIAGDTSLLLVEKDGYVAIIHRDLVINLFAGEPDISIGVFGSAAKTPSAYRGLFNPAWISKLQNSPNMHFFDGQFVVAGRQSQKYDVWTFAAVPATRIDEETRALASILIPLGLACSLALAFLLWLIEKRRKSLTSMLRAALKTKDLYLLYQPIVRLQTREYVGAEALCRWRRRDGSIVQPDIFIRIAEEAGMIQQITGRTIDSVVNDGLALFAQYPHFHIGINLSGTDLESHEIAEKLQQVIERKYILPDNLLLEATERTLLKAHLATEVISRLRSLGIAIAIDDFGTGYSSLSYLTSFRFDYLKIDKAFVDTIGKETVTSDVIFHIIKMAQSLKLSIIAEGVETEQQAQFLAEHGVEFAQGWLFGKAMTMQELKTRIHKI